MTDPSPDPSADPSADSLAEPLGDPIGAPLAEPFAGPQAGTPAGPPADDQPGGSSGPLADPTIAVQTTEGTMGGGEDGRGERPFGFSAQCKSEGGGKVRKGRVIGRWFDPQLPMWLVAAAARCEAEAAGAEINVVPTSEEISAVVADVQTVPISAGSTAVATVAVEVELVEDQQAEIAQPEVRFLVVWVLMVLFERQWVFCIRIQGILETKCR